MWAEKHGNEWRIRDRVAGKIVTLAAGYPTKTAARDGIILLKGEQVRGEALVPRGGAITVGEWIDLWWPTYEVNLKPSSRTSSAGLLRRYIRPMLGAHTLDDLAGNPLVIKRWVSDLLAGRTQTRRPLAPKTVHNAHGQLHRLMADAVVQRLIRSNPCEHTGLPEISRDEMRFLTEQEAERLISAVPERWRPLILLMLFTGLRWGEAIGLRVGRMDVLTRRLMVVETLQELAGTGEMVFVSPKSKQSRRTVTFPVRIAAELAELVGMRGRDALVFTAVQGGPVRYRQFRRRIWVPSCQRAGLDGLRLHDLRHTHAAWLISAGVPMLAVSRRLGHASITITMDRYGHLLPEVDGSIVGALDGALDKIEFGSNVGAARPEPNGGELTTADSFPGQWL